MYLKRFVVYLLIIYLRVFRMGGTICRSRPETQVSRSIINLPWYFVNRFLDSVRIAEEKLGHPPAIFEIFVTMEDTYGR